MESKKHFYLELLQGLIDAGNEHIEGFRANELSEGYHTFDELYEFRKLYNAALFNEWARDWYHLYHSGSALLMDMKDDEPWPLYGAHKSWRLHDGELCFGGGWFVATAWLPDGQISNHYKAEDWDLFRIPEEPKVIWPFDGHTSEDVTKRLEALCKHARTAPTAQYNPPNHE